MSLHRRILAELDRRASLQNMTRAQLQENILWAVLFPNEPNPKAFQAAAKAAFKQSKIAWLEARETEKQAREAIIDTPKADPEPRREVQKTKKESKQEAAKQARIEAQKAKKAAQKAKREARLQAKGVLEEARWQAKIDESKARWRAKWLRS